MVKLSVATLPLTAHRAGATTGEDRRDRWGHLSPGGMPPSRLRARHFDAIVGRYVLQFMPDPAGSLKRIARHLPARRLHHVFMSWTGMARGLHLLLEPMTKFASG